MLNLIIAIICSSLLSIVMRASEKHVKGNLGMTATNYVVCVVFGAIYSGANNLFPNTESLKFTLGTGMFTGVLYLAGLLLIQLNIKKNGVVLSSIFQKLGLIVQVMISIVFFKEYPEVMQVAGILLGLFAVVLINYEKEQTAINFKAGLILILIVSGICEGMSKVHEELGDSALSEHFLLYTFGTALIACLLLIVIKKEKFEWKQIGFGILIGVPNYFAARFLLKSLNEIPAVLVFPMYSVGTIVVITLAGLLVFKEKLSKKQWVALALILAALILLNI